MPSSATTTSAGASPSRSPSRDRGRSAAPPRSHRCQPAPSRCIMTHAVVVRDEQRAPAYRRRAAMRAARGRAGSSISSAGADAAACVDRRDGNPRRVRLAYATARPPSAPSGPATKQLRAAPSRVSRPGLEPAVVIAKGRQAAGVARPAASGGSPRQERDRRRARSDAEVAARLKGDLRLRWRPPCSQPARQRRRGSEPRARSSRGCGDRLTRPSFCRRPRRVASSSRPTSHGDTEARRYRCREVKQGLGTGAQAERATGCPSRSGHRSRGGDAAQPVRRPISRPVRRTFGRLRASARRGETLRHPHPFERHAHRVRLEAERLAYDRETERRTLPAAT